MPHLDPARSCVTPRQFWSAHREASLNWLALGLLLAAWNASGGDADASPGAGPGVQTASNLVKGHKSVNVL